jgi:hypothetical protein
MGALAGIFKSLDIFSSAETALSFSEQLVIKILNLF